MPMIVQRSTHFQNNHQSIKPWFRTNKIAAIVQLSIGSTIAWAGAKLKATPKELKAAQEMREEWDSETFFKVRQAIEISNRWGIGRSY